MVALLRGLAGKLCDPWGVGWSWRRAGDLRHDLSGAVRSRDRDLGGVVSVLQALEAVELMF
jgi:hypothetical protein